MMTASSPGPQDAGHLRAVTLGTAWQQERIPQLGLDRPQVPAVCGGIEAGGWPDLPAQPR
jgi:hypothetical protein